MGRKLDFSELISLFEQGRDFEITDTQYQEKFGKAMPKDAYYIRKQSPLSLYAKEHGFVLQVTEAPIIQRSILFKRIK